MADSAIEWTDATWNPTTGCDRVSPGCANCYALSLAKRLKAMGQPKYQRDGGKASGPGFGLTLHPDTLDAPMRWRKPRLVFVNSMSDLFHEKVPLDFIAAVFEVMARCPQHTFQVLTKRADRLPAIMAVLESLGDWPTWPLPNVWLGVSIENRRFVHRADLLRQTPAAVRFISAEPLLGPLCHDSSGTHTDGVERPWWQEEFRCWSDEYEGAQLDLTGIDWLIVGGESGPKHRRLDPQWMLDLRDASEQAGTAFFVKQLGGHRPGNRIEDLPDGLRIRQMPARTAVAS